MIRFHRGDSAVLLHRDIIETLLANVLTRKSFLPDTGYTILGRKRELRIRSPEFTREVITSRGVDTEAAILGSVCQSYIRSPLLLFLCPGIYDVPICDLSLLHDNISNDIERKLDCTILGASATMKYRFDIHIVFSHVVP